MEEHVELFKIVIVGDGGVGKSAITIQLTQAHFITEYDPTIENSYRKPLHVDGQMCVLDILDTAGQEEYSAMRDQYFRTGHGFVIVFSVTDRVSFKSVPNYLNHIKRVKDAPSYPMVICANKVFSFIRSFIHSFFLSFFHTSFTFSHTHIQDSYQSPFPHHLSPRPLFTPPSHALKQNANRPSNQTKPSHHRMPTQCDVPDRDVESGEVSALGDNLHVPVFETSAKLRQNVDEAFFQIVREVKSMDGDGLSIVGYNNIVMGF